MSNNLKQSRLQQRDKRSSTLPKDAAGKQKSNKYTVQPEKGSNAGLRSNASSATSVTSRKRVKSSTASSKASLKSVRSITSNSDIQLNVDSRLEDFDDAVEDELVEQDVKFINVPSEREKSAEPGKKQISAKKQTEITEQLVLNLSQETEPSHVYEVELSGKHISTIQNLEKFTRIKVLDLSCNYLKNIDNLDKNQELRELKLYDNCISCVDNLEKLKELSTLQLQHNQIGSLGKGFSSLRKLNILRLDSNQITSLNVRELAPLGKLTSLDISSNRLDNINAVNCLSSLEELFCRNNRLRTVPDLSKSSKLQEVDFSYNQLANLSGLKSLPQLTVINVSHNQLTSLKSLGKLKGLEELFVSHNRITDIGCVVEFYPSLQILDIRYNYIEHWKQMCSLSGFHDLVELFIANNPICIQDGEKSNFIQEIQKLLPQLQVLDGALMKKTAARTGTPLMRPMTASSIVSARQVEAQMNHMKHEMTTFEESLSKRFDSLRDILQTLPDRPPSLNLSLPSSSRPASKCSKRSRIHQARQFALHHFEAEHYENSDSSDD